MRTISDRSLALLLAVLAALWIVMLLVGGPESGFDPELLAAARISSLFHAARFITDLASWQALLVAGAGGAILLMLRGARRAGLVLLLIILSQRLLVELQKYQFDRVRPDPEGHIVAVISQSYPSGHSANAMAGALALALLLTAGRRGRGAAIALALLFAFLVGASRMILQVHWPSDVVGGWAFGAAWTLLLVRLLGGFGGSQAEIPSGSVPGTMTNRIDHTGSDPDIRDKV